MEETKKINICFACVHFEKDGCVPSCNKDMHKGYTLIEECVEFVDKQRTDKAISRIENILFETELDEKEKRFVLEKII